MFKSYFPILCEAIDHNVMTVASHCIQLISKRTLEITMINTTPACDRACVYLLMNYIGIYKHPKISKNIY